MLSDLLNKITDTIDNVALIKEIRIKNNSKTGLIIRLQRLSKLDRNIFQKKLKSNLQKTISFHTFILTKIFIMPKS